jgi:Cu(I)/Ag(I) efflux system membrane fusion protein
MDMQLMPRHTGEAGAGKKVASADKGEQKKALYWYDPMRPDQHFDKPGKSPFMDMQLVPMYAEEASGSPRQGTIAIDPRMLQNLGIRTAPVEHGMITRRLRTTGSVMANENHIEVVQSRTAGWVERLHVRAVNDPVHKGQLLAEVYSPDLLAAQQEFLLALHAARDYPDTGTLVQASRERLSFLGLSEAQIAQIEKAGKAQRRVAFFSPINGVVAELGVREGAQMNPGMTLFNLVDLSQVWVTAQITEAQAAWIAQGQPAEASVPALPGKIFKGQVDYVYPEVMAETRTLKARIVLDNPGLELKPGMYASVIFVGGEQREALLVPSEALIKTGTRSVVIVAEGEGRFVPMEVTVGDEAGGKIEIRDGLQAGQQVVASGQFLIDSEANLRGALERLAPAGETQPADAMKDLDGMETKNEQSAEATKKMDREKSR